MEKKRLYLYWEKSSTPIYCINQIEYAIGRGITTIEIVAPKGIKTYPNVCVPLAGILEWYENRGMNINFFFAGKNNYVQHTAINKPYVVEEEMKNINIRYPLDKVWKYSTPEGVNALVTAIISALRESAVLETGVLTSTEWCLNEVMDNVLQHSEAKCGFVMGQLHKGKQRISICVFDMGIGIYNTLKNSKHLPRKPLDAITLALQERVTRDEKVGQGNGMWGLSKIIEENDGSVRILSNGAFYEFRHGEVNTGENIALKVGDYNNATLVDFQIDFSNKVDIAKALNGNKPSDFWVEEREIDDGVICFKVKDDSPGTGTRVAAKKFKNIIFNCLNEENKKIVLDFEGVNLVSSSYADELIGKIIAERGFTYFMKYFELNNLSATNTGVINRSVEQRMAQTYYDETIKDVDDEM